MQLGSLGYDEIAIFDQYLALSRKGHIVTMERQQELAFDLSK